MLNERERALIKDVELYKRQCKLIKGEYEVFAQKTNVELKELRTENEKLKTELITLKSS